MTYYKRIIDKKLLEWKASQRRKPLLIRGARQVGKSSAVRHFGKEFKYFVEINLESQPSIRGLFSKDIENDSYRKYLFLDLGLMQTMLGTPAANVLLASDVDFVNKGAASEMFAGLELVKNHDCFQKAEMYYWQNLSRGTNAEIDFLEAKDGMVLPIEVKATTRGSMQSLWLFMRKKALHHAVRTSLENFGEFEYVDKESQDAIRHVDVIPLYAMSNLCKLSVDTEMKIATP